jgi:hypothetical protein
MNTEFVWRRLDESDEMPGNGAIIVIANDKDPFRWASLPIDSSREDVERAFSCGYCRYGPAVCQATIMAEGTMIDQCQFAVHVAVLTQAAQNGDESVHPLALGKHPFESRASETANLR